VSKCNADVLLMQWNNPALVHVEYFPLQTHGSTVWKSPPQPLVQPLEASLLPALMQASQICLTNTQKPPRVASHSHSEDPSQGDFFPNVQAEIPVLQEQFLVKSFLEKGGERKRGEQRKNLRIRKAQMFASGLRLNQLALCPVFALPMTAYQ